MEDNLKCGEIIYVNNKLKYLCCLCDKYENLAQQFEEHIYSVHLSFIKVEELQESPLPPNDPMITDQLLLDIDCVLIEKKDLVKKEEILIDDNNLITVTTLPQINYRNKIKSNVTILNKENDNLVENLLDSSNLPLSSSSSSLSRSPSPPHSESTIKTPISSETICNHCKKDFLTNKILKNHNRNKPLSCPICMTNVCGIRILNEHMLTDHRDSIPLPIKPKRKAKITYHYCDVCNGTFKSFQNIKRHMIIHTGEKPFSCDKCDKRFTNSAGLTCHIRNHHQDERPFLCNECGKSFKMLMALNAHVRSNHEARQPQQCPLCPKVLSKRKSLMAHLRRHSTNITYKCKECGKILKSSKCLSQHKRIHLQTKLYQCPFCDMRFAQSAGRRGHVRNMHE